MLYRETNFGIYWENLKERECILQHNVGLHVTGLQTVREAVLRAEWDAIQVAVKPTQELTIEQLSNKHAGTGQ